ncbi:Crp/Fnr family transcriptional regulator [Mesorhizobium sp. Root552]|jgi:CRP-like cAMP-binding protein|uniref:Crp/Fnr family transcriptional regulator n=1 Tax=Mesorhizobium sp. Root552 TaxID=1736555 RepID=UPI0006FC2882|nr:Crp/Fnr family transcriptional regulator [Mesorhizobium sp. Root552]KQZ28921.1 Crp/Fnr family transcriptional regulator [Mesorhizobium sp. Root552]
MGKKNFVADKIVWLDSHRPASRRASMTKQNRPVEAAGTFDQSFSDRDLFELLFDNCVADRVPAGRHLFLQEDRSDRIFGLVDGSVEISIYSIDGQKLVANMQTPPNIIGEIGALDGGLRTATAICRTDCMIVSLDRTQLLRRIEESPILARSMLRLICRRVRWVSESLGDQAFLNVEVRLAKRLLLLDRLLADEAGWIAISQSEIAEFLGATRESVNKLINAWRSRSLIDIKRGRIKVANARSLRQMATDEG